MGFWKHCCGLRLCDSIQNKVIREWTGVGTSIVTIEAKVYITEWAYTRDKRQKMAKELLK